MTMDYVALPKVARYMDSAYGQSVDLFWSSSFPLFAQSDSDAG